MQAANDAWSIVEINYEDGTLAKCRFRPNLQKDLSYSGYDHFVTFTWSYQADQKNKNLPFLEELKNMQELETKLTDDMEEKSIGVVAFTYTFNGKHDISFYVCDMELFSMAINSLLEPGLPIEINACSDPKWLELESILKMVKGENS